MVGKVEISIKDSDSKFFSHFGQTNFLANTKLESLTDNYSLERQFSLAKGAPKEAFKEIALYSISEDIKKIFFKEDLEKATEKEKENFYKAYVKSSKEDSQKEFIQRWGLKNLKLSLGNKRIIF